MVVNLFLFIVLGAQKVVSEEYVDLELNLLTNDSVYSCEANFVNSKVLTHDVNPGYKIKKVTQGGLKVWESETYGETVTNAVVVFGEYLPKLVSLVVTTHQNESKLLYYVYTLDAWVNLNNLDLNGKNLLEPKEETGSPLHLTNGEQYFNLPQEKEDEDKYEVDMDIQDGFISKFDFQFTYSLNKYTYMYTPRKGVVVRTIKEGKTDIWKTNKGQVVKQIVTEKISGVFSSVKVSYLEFDEPKESLYVKKDNKWNLSEPSYQPPSKKAKFELDNRNLGELIKPVRKLALLDLNEIPEPPSCRKCTYLIDGVVSNIIYLSSETNVRRVVDGKMKVYDVPDGWFLSNGIYYTKNEEIVLVDLATFKGKEVETKYFQKNKNEYVSLTSQEFERALKRYKEVEVVLDISTTKEGYTETSYSRLDLEYHIFTPIEGYVIKKVQEENLPILESSSPIIDAIVYYFKGQKMLLDILVRDPSLGREFFTYSKQHQKWVRVSQDFYFTLINQYSKDSPLMNPSLDILTQKKNEYVDVIENETLGYYQFIPKNNLELTSVCEGKRMIWTSRFEKEKVSFVWYHLNTKLVYVSSLDGIKLRQYAYMKEGNVWKSFNQSDFSKMFSFLYSKNLTVDISTEFNHDVIVEKKGNAFMVKSKPGYLIKRIRYGNRLIWVGTDQTKCESFKLQFGLWETYIHIDLVNISSQNFTLYLKTVDGSYNSWVVCDPMPDLEEKFKPQSKEDKLEQQFVKENTLESVKPEETNFENMQLVPLKETTPSPKSETPKQNEEEVKDESKVPSKKKVSLSGDYLIITEVNTTKGTPVDTELSTDTTQEINGFKVGPKSVSVYNPQIFNDSNTPNSVRDLKVNNPFNSQGSQLLALTLEPHNKEESPKPSDLNNVKKDVKPENKDTKVNSQKGPSKLVNFKKSDPSGKVNQNKPQNTPNYPTKKEPRGVKSDDLLRDRKLWSTSTNGVKEEDANKESFDSKSESDTVSSVLEAKDKLDPNCKRESQSSVNSQGEKSSPETVNYKTKESETTFKQTSCYKTGLLYLKDLSTQFDGLSSSEYGDFRDCRPQGYNYLLYTPKPEYPVRRFQDAFQTIWTSPREECLALSVFLENGLPVAAELFVRDLADVRRRFYNLDGFRWREVTAEKYDEITSRK